MVRIVAVLTLLAHCAVASPADLLDIDGNLIPTVGTAGQPPIVVYFVTHDCPISNRLMPEIRRICEEYEDRDARCVLAYVDPTLTADEIRAHQAEFSSGAPAVLDSDHRLVALAGATVTPEAALFDRRGALAYRGRVNNLYAALGTPRRRPTKHDLRRALDEVLGSRPVSTPRTQAVGCFIPTLRADLKER